MLRAAQEGVTPEAARTHQRRARDFADFGVAFDNYYSTHSPENRELAQPIYKNSGRRPRRQTHHQTGVRSAEADVPAGPLHQGRVPALRASDQHGDSCEACGATTRRPNSRTRSPCSRVPSRWRRNQALFLQARRLREHATFVAVPGNHRAATRAAGGSRTSSTGGSTTTSRTGTSRATRPTSASRFPMLRASTSTSGSTRPSATWRVSRTCAPGTNSISTTSGARTPRPSCITSSARTSSISTRCSGRPCSKVRASVNQAQCGRMVSSPWTAKRCPSRAAPSSLRAYLDHLNPVPALLLRRQTRPRGFGRHRSQPR